VAVFGCNINETPYYTTAKMGFTTQNSPPCNIHLPKQGINPSLATTSTQLGYNMPSNEVVSLTRINSTQLDPNRYQIHLDIELSLPTKEIGPAKEKYTTPTKDMTQHQEKTTLGK
jgi:hypothetical protein